MNRKKQRQTPQICTDDDIRSAVSLEKEEYIKEFDEAQQRQVPELENNSSELGYQKLMNRIRLEGIEPHKEPDCTVKKKRKKAKYLKPLLIAALLGTMIFGFGIGVVAKKSYDYDGTYKEYKEWNLVWDNDSNKKTNDDLEKVYQEIGVRQGIPVLRLTEMPEDLSFRHYRKDGDTSILTFEYQGNQIYLAEMRYEVENSASYVGEQKADATVYNVFLQQEIPIGEKLLENGEVEYRAELQKGEGIYCLNGKIDKEIFIRLVEGLSF